MAETVFVDNQSDAKLIFFADQGYLVLPLGETKQDKAQVKQARKHHRKRYDGLEAYIKSGLVTIREPRSVPPETDAEASLAESTQAAEVSSEQAAQAAQGASEAAQGWSEAMQDAAQAHREASNRLDTAPDPANYDVDLDASEDAANYQNWYSYATDGLGLDYSSKPKKPELMQDVFERLNELANA